MKKKRPRLVYFHEKDSRGRYYVYYVQYGPVKTLFDIKNSEEEAEQAIREHKAGTHATQYKPE